jgi:hypothetical protein
MQAEGERALQSLLGQQAFEKLQQANPKLVQPGGEVTRGQRVQNVISTPGTP